MALPVVYNIPATPILAIASITIRLLGILVCLFWSCFVLDDTPHQMHVFPPNVSLL